MPHFLIKKEEVNENYISLTDNENLFHLSKVLRVKAGEILKFIDENQIVYHARVTEVSKSTLKAEILETHKSIRFLKSNLVLIQSILMSDAQNLAIANAVQSGIKEIYPVISDNTSVNKNSLKNKIEKWEKIAIENFKQCERADVPEIHEIEELKATLSKFKPQNILIFAEKLENTTLDNCLKDCDKNDKIAIVIGPEGGFSDSEFNYFINKKYKLITLGKMIYKAPNAIVAGISNIVSRIEDDI